jgi:hypothetical protein
MEFAKIPVDKPREYRETVWLRRHNLRSGFDTIKADV